MQELLDAFKGTRPLMLPEELGEGGRQKEQQARRPLLPQAAGPAMRLSCMDTPQDIHTCYVRGGCQVLHLAELNPRAALALSAGTIPGCQVQLMVAIATAHA